MGGGERTPKKSPKKPRGKHVSAKSMIDDEAAESDDGVVVPSGGAPDGPAYGSGDDLDQYEEEFINDGDPFHDDDEDSDSDLPASVMPHPKTPPNKKQTKRASPVIELSSSSEEDLTAMDVDDRMFKKPTGIKPSALPPAVATRSATAKRAASSQSSQPQQESPKKAKTTGQSTGTKAVPLPLPLPAPLQDASGFMTQFMTQYMSSQAPPAVSPVPTTLEPAFREASPRRVDFDDIELQKGLKASRAASRSQQKLDLSTRGAGSSKHRPPSPNWEPPYEGDAAEPVPTNTKGKGKGKELKDKGKARAVSKSVASDLISRMQSGEDIREAPIPDTPAVVPVAPAAPTGPPLTLQQYFALHGNVEATAGAIAEPVERAASDSEDHPTVFMEQLETYKAYYDPLAPCGVNDKDLQDPVLVNTYIGQPPLPPDRAVLPVYDPSRLSGMDAPPMKGGRVKFSTWARYIPPILADNAIGAVLFREANPNFINPSRVSPLRLTSQISAGSAATQRLMVDGRVAMCVSPVFCTESFVVEARKIGANSERTRKWLSGIFHNQEWERFESLICLVFGEPILYAQLTPKKSMSFQTMMSPANATAAQDTDTAFAGAPSDMFAPLTPSKSPAKSKSPSKPWNFTSKTLLAAHDKVPIYDARKVVLDFSADLERLDRVLPPFHGEIPFGSFVVVGYTVAGYKATLSAGGERVPHLGCNVLWAIVCGTPPLKASTKQ
ncbi:hypothetical protein C8R47DRAFT_1227355 [Mycena vitilis]|nr:hypothetical protein C8R47DRAFT_1227355 [Mycena vitilis]